MSRRIVWEYFQSPLNDDSDEDDDNDDDEFGGISVTNLSNKIAVGPFGIIPIAKLADSLRLQFWLAHTDFSISMQDKKIMENVPGIEAIKFFSRYRFLILVGELFDSSTVKADLQAALGVEVRRAPRNMSLNEILTNKVESALKALDDVKNYSLLVLPNGALDIIASPTIDSNYKEKLELHQLTHTLTNCYHLTS